LNDCIDDYQSSNKNQIIEKACFYVSFLLIHMCGEEVSRYCHT